MVMRRLIKLIRKPKPSRPAPARPTSKKVVRMRGCCGGKKK